MAATELGPGTVLGNDDRYRLERVLGLGGMASVWLAFDRRLGRSVAIKVPSDTLALDREYVARFEREARVAAGLSHPHLVKVYDFSVASSRPFLVMEYVAGDNLAASLALPGEREWDAELLAQELLSALDYIHRAGIVHRDIKPANVLIATDGHARLTDFGIAQPADATRLTRTGMIVGSDRYIAPEVRRGAPATALSDLYACGVLIEECLPTPPNDRLVALAAALTATAPERRPASGAEAIAMLGRSAGRAAARRDAHAGARPVRRVPRRRRPVEPPATAATAVRPMLAPPRTASTRVRREPVTHATAPTVVHATPQTRPAPRDSLRRRLLLALVAFAVAIVTAVAVVALDPPRSGRPPSSAPRLTPARASLAQQLTDLDQAVGRSRR